MIIEIFWDIKDSEVLACEQQIKSVPSHKITHLVEKVFFAISWVCMNMWGFSHHSGQSTKNNMVKDIKMVCCVNQHETKPIGN